MHVIILAAGKSKRFKDVGYSMPKQFLPISWRGKVLPMVSHVLRSLPASVHKVTLAVPVDYIDIAKNMLQTHGHTAVICGVEPTKGPAHTASLVLDRTAPSSSLLILDSDVINHTNDLWWLSQGSVCGVLVSKSDNPACSYVDRIGYFTHIKEKERISEYAVKGAYFVPKYLIVKFRESLKIVMQYPEPFISHALENMQEGMYALEATYDPVDWGTPEAVKASGAEICSF